MIVYPVPNPEAEQSVIGLRSIEILVPGHGYPAPTAKRRGTFKKREGLVESPGLTAEMAVEALREGRFDHFSRLLCELERLVPSRDEVRQHLVTAGLPLAYLEKAAEAAKKGRAEEAAHLHARACSYVDADEVAVLTEENRLSFIVLRPAEEPRPARGYSLAG